METQQLKTFKDFLQFYNIMSEMCFSNCVTSFASRHLNSDEETCVDRCASKYINCNNRLIKVYAEVQEKVVARRLKEFEEAQNKEIEQKAMADNDEEATKGKAIEETVS